MIDLDPKHLELVKKILKQQAPQYLVLVFGSRIEGTAKKYSDLDLVLKGDEKVPLKILSSLKEALAKSNLPFQVDIIDWHRITPEFQGVIMRRFLVVQNKVNPKRT